MSTPGETEPDDSSEGGAASDSPSPGSERPSKGAETKKRGGRWKRRLLYVGVAVPVLGVAMWLAVLVSGLLVLTLIGNGRPGSAYFGFQGAIAYVIAMAHGGGQAVIARLPGLRQQPLDAVGGGVVEAADLQQHLDAIGFNLVGYGCTTCIGNSGPLPPQVATAIEEGELVASAVLSGNRNFEGRVSPHVKANYLASPPLVVAYALAGTTDIDLVSEPLGADSAGKPVTLAVNKSEGLDQALAGSITSYRSAVEAAAGAWHRRDEVL